MENYTNLIFGLTIALFGAGYTIVKERQERAALRQFRANIRPGEMAWYKQGNYKGYLKVIITHVSADAVTCKFLHTGNLETCNKSKIYPL